MVNNSGRLNKKEHDWYKEILARCNGADLTPFESRFVASFNDRFTRFGMHTQVSTKQHETFMRLEEKCNDQGR
jgi:hypothetical protein